MANQILIVRQPLYGTVTWDGVEFKYVPNIGFSGTDYYIYTVTDGLTSQTITNYVNTNNLPPIASDVSLTINAADITTINIDNYISDPNTPLENIKIISLTKPFYGIASFKDNIITYQSNGFNATEIFSYTISDGQYEATAKIRLNITNGANPQIPDYILDALNTLENEMNTVSINSGNWDASYTLLSSKSAAWNSIDPVRYNEVSNIVETYSADWNAVGSRSDDILSAYTIVNTKSGSWEQILSSIDTITNIYSADSGSWTDAYNIVYANSANWDKNINDLESISSYFSGNSSNWESTYNTVCATSALWDKEPLNSFLSSNSGYWDISYTVVTSKSASWDDTYTGLTSLSTLFYDNSGNWDSAYNTVCAESASWDKYALTSYLTATSGNWVDAANTLSSSSAAWNDLVASFSALSTDYYNISGNWESVYNTVCAESASWDKYALTSYLTANSGDWTNGYTVVCAKSADWNELANSVSALSTDYNSNYEKWDLAYSIVSSSSAKWNNTSVKTTIEINSGDWTASFNILTGSSGDWNSSYNTITALSTNYETSSSNWETTYTTVCSNSSDWGDRTAYTIVVNNSSNWNNSYTTLSSNSANWNAVSAYYEKYDSAYNTLTSASGDWYDNYNVVSSNSAIWNSNSTTIDTYSAKWLSGGSDTNLSVKDLIVSGDAVFYGSLTAQGTTTQLNTEVVATSAFQVINTGFVDALRVAKTETTGAIASFESNGNPVLYVSPLNKVGINTNNPNEALTVIGNISASGTIHGSLPIEYTTFINNSSKYEDSFTFLSQNSSVIKSVSDNKPGYDNVYTFLTGVSSDINDIASNRYNYYNAYNVVATQSAQTYASYTFLTGNSANIGTDTIYRQNIQKYEAASNIISSITGETAQINFIFDGGGGIIDSGASGMIQIPQNIKINSWVLISDVAANAAVQILSSNYSSYPNYISIISDSNIPTLNNQFKSTNTSTLTNWITSINANTILKFRLIRNNAATSITFSINCTKY